MSSCEKKCSLSFFGQIAIVMIDDWYSDPFHLLKISV